MGQTPIGTYGNEEADKAAKEVLNLQSATQIGIPRSHIKPLFKVEIIMKWLHIWDNAITGISKESLQNNYILTQFLTNH